MGSPVRIFPIVAFGSGEATLLDLTNIAYEDKEFVVFGGGGEAFVYSLNPLVSDFSFMFFGSSGEAFEIQGQWAFDQAFPLVGAGKATVPVELTELFLYGTGPATVPIKHDMVTLGDTVVPVEHTMYDPSFVAANPMRWKVQVLLNAVDVTADCVENVEVEAEEGLPRIARFVYRPSGTVSVPSWVGKSVQVNFQQVDISGSVLVTVRIFTGLVDVPEYDPAQNTVTFLCIDNLNGVVGQQPRAALDQMIGGYWSPFVFDEDDNSLEYAEHQLSTVPKAMDMDAYQGLRVTDWEAKATPDFVFDNTNALDNSISFDMVNRSEIVNRVNLTYQYRYPRLMAGRAFITWSMGVTLLQVFLTQFTIPTRSMGDQAVAGLAPWKMPEGAVVEYSPPPPTQAVGFSAFWICSPAVQAVLFWEMFVYVIRRWVQTATEQYNITIEYAEGVTALGPLVEEDSASMEVPGVLFDTAKWEADHTLEPLPTFAGGLPANKVEIWTQELTAYAGYDRPESDLAVVCLQNKAKTTILESHRKNRVHFSAPLNPFLDLIHTVEVDINHIHAQGKVVRIVFSMDAASTGATMDVDLAISGSGAVGVPVDDPLPAPTPPPLPTPTQDIEVEEHTTLEMAQATSPPPTSIPYFGHIGYIGNSRGGPGFLEENSVVPEFRLKAPEIPATEVDPKLVESTVSLTIKVPEDLLIITG